VAATQERRVTANERQEGGAHYQTRDGLPQHWDLAIQYDWDYFQGQIIKYIMRWKAKGETPAKRKLDLEKARHFLDKYIENFQVYDTRFRNPPPQPEGVVPLQPPTKYDSVGSFKQYEQELSTYATDNDFMVEGGFGRGDIIYRCRHCRVHLHATGLEHAHQLHQCPQAPPLEVRVEG
jgi:hypothetical protein